VISAINPMEINFGNFPSKNIISSTRRVKREAWKKKKSDEKLVYEENNFWKNEKGIKWEKRERRFAVDGFSDVKFARNNIW
jgi:hypothetical protein